MNGIVENCMSGMRFKIRIDQDTTYLALNLLGVRTMANDQNQPEQLEFATQAHEYAKDTLYQKDVTIEPEFTDKRGTFFGTLWFGGKNDFAIHLLEQGFAMTNS